MTEEGTEFGRQLREHRKTAGLSQARAAELAGLSLARWRQYEQGYADNPAGRTIARPSIKNVPAIANAVNWDRDEALRATGFNPEELQLEPEVKAEVPQVVVNAWPHLSKKWQDLITDLVLEASRQSATRGENLTPPATPAPASTPLFSSTEEPVFSDTPQSRSRRR
jgi:transcriptional regulator with XRE-family HTH domain